MVKHTDFDLSEGSYSDIYVCECGRGCMSSDACVASRASKVRDAGPVRRDSVVESGSEDESGARVYLSTKKLNVRVKSTASHPVPTCLHLLCKALGLNVSEHVSKPSNIDSVVRQRLAECEDYKVWFVAYSLDDKRNHVELVPGSTKSTTVSVCPLMVSRHGKRLTGVTSMQEFFTLGGRHFNTSYYASAGDSAAVPAGSEFGGDVVSSQQPAAVRGATPTIPHRAPEASYGARAGAGVRGRYDSPVPSAPQSVVDESSPHGAANVSGGVVRRARRKIEAKGRVLSGEPVQRNYALVSSVMFNNADELFQDMISREYAQEIIEEVFTAWGIPFDQPGAMKYAEDLMLLFLITNTASNKADYNSVYAVPTEPFSHNGLYVSEVDADFAKLSFILESVHGVTRRQFARAIADDQRTFLKHEANKPLLPRIATRVGCETALAYLAFDGSTHCSGLTTREVSFVKTLEGRNLFERDDIVASGSSQRLMQGFSGGIGSVNPR